MGSLTSLLIEILVGILSTAALIMLRGLWHVIVKAHELEKENVRLNAEVKGIEKALERVNQLLRDALNRQAKS